ncbi:MAG TPA: dienelactone hydrolase family protein, partial [Parachlamydiaceae bacterium]|nr:dienelactone hydrolase family protein [Parachlamydiaceae bacterium]
YNIMEQGKKIEKASKAMIALHGRGGTAANILGLAHELCDDTFYMAAPKATNNSWYPNSFMSEDETNEPWLHSAVDTIQKLINETSRYIPKSQIYLMGFSQGACLSLEVSAREATKYGGIIAFSGGLIGKKIQKERYKGNYSGTKIFLGISERDPHIPLHRVDESRELTEAMGADVTMKVYPGSTHTINGDESSWVKKNIIGF